MTIHFCQAILSLLLNGGFLSNFMLLEIPPLRCLIVASRFAWKMFNRILAHTQTASSFNIDYVYLYRKLFHKRKNYFESKAVKLNLLFYKNFVCILQTEYLNDKLMFYRIILFETMKIYRVN
jgi:hypothetical protein